MTSVSDILNHAWNKDAVNLMPALDNIMTSRIADQIELRKADVAASTFSNTNGQDELDAPELDSNAEGSETDENI